MENRPLTRKMGSLVVSRVPTVPHMPAMVNLNSSKGKVRFFFIVYRTMIEEEDEEEKRKTQGPGTVT